MKTNGPTPTAPARSSADQADLDDRYDEALELGHAGQWDRATRLFVECVAGDPGNPDFVQTFLEHLSRKPEQGSNGDSPGTDLPADVQQAATQQDWPAVQRLAARQLAASPGHVKLLAILAEAAAHQGQPEVELAYLQHALVAAPEDVEINRRLAAALERMCRFDEALDCWRRLEELDPENCQLAQQIAQVTVERNRQQLGLANHQGQAAGAEQGGSLPRSAAKPRLVRRRPLVGTSLAGPNSATNIKRTPIQELEVAIREFPSNAEYYVQLVPLYLDTGREYDAEKLLAKGRQATSNDARVCQMWEDVAMMRMERKLSLAEKHAQDEVTPQSQSELAEIRAERDQLETDIFVSRCQREPGNAAVRIELAKRLRRAGKVREACQRLEEALRSAEERSPAALELGECQRQLNEPTEALRYYRMASESASRPGHLEIKKQALYQGGSLAAGLKMRRLAERYLTELLQLDSSYKDAPGLLAKLHGPADTPA